MHIFIMVIYFLPLTIDFFYWHTIYKVMSKEMLCQIKFIVWICVI